MSGEQGFLRRWSRRKHAPRSLPREQPTTEPRDEGGDEETGAAAKPISPPQSSAPPPPVPPIETIDQGTDIRPFLAAGVPEEMTRAALRRAWSTDPAIRDFVGLSENFWESTTGAETPGFGSLTVDEARRLLARLTGASEEPGPPEHESAATSNEGSPDRKGGDS